MADETTSNGSNEDAVRKYLLFIDDPSRLRDPALIQRRTAAVVNATDPIEKLKALAELERASVVDGSGLEEAFVAAAKDWAEEHGVSAGAFAELNVPIDVLAEAGFDVAGLRKGRGRSAPPRRSSSSSGSSGGGGRRSSVGADDIKAAMLDTDSPFTLTEISEKVGGGSPATLRKVAEDLLAGGQITKLGPAPNHGQRGRAPMQYARA